MLICVMHSVLRTISKKQKNKRHRQLSALPFLVLSLFIYFAVMWTLLFPIELLG